MILLYVNCWASALPRKGQDYVRNRTASVSEGNVFARGLAVLMIATVYLASLALVLEMVHRAPLIDDPSWS